MTKGNSDGYDGFDGGRTGVSGFAATTTRSLKFLPLKSGTDGFSYTSNDPVHQCDANFNFTYDAYFMAKEGVPCEEYGLTTVTVPEPEASFR